MSNRNGTFEELSVKENHEIEHICNVLNDRIRNARRSKSDTFNIEEDLCYAQRELEIRYARANWAENRK